MLVGHTGVVTRDLARSTESLGIKTPIAKLQKTVAIESVKTFTDYSENASSGRPGDDRLQRRLQPMADHASRERAQLGVVKLAQERQGPDQPHGHGHGRIGDLKQNT